MSISKQEQTFLTYIQEQALTVFNTEEVRHFWGSPENTDNALSRLLHKNQLCRLSRGVYATPNFLDSIRDDPHLGQCLIAPHLVADCALAYGSAMHAHGMSAVSPDKGTCIVQTLHRKKEMQLEHHQFLFVQVKPEHFFDVFSMNIQGHTVPVTGLEKTILDGANHPHLAGGADLLLQFIQQFSFEIRWEHLTQSIVFMQNGAIIKRLGYLVEQFHVALPDRQKILCQWKSQMTQGVIKLDPKIETTGHIHTHWQIEDNIFDCKGTPK